MGAMKVAIFILYALWRGNRPATIKDLQRKYLDESIIHNGGI